MQHSEKTLVVFHYCGRFFKNNSHSRVILNDKQDPFLDIKDLFYNLSTAVGCYVIGLLDCYTEYLDDEMVPFVFKVNNSSAEGKRQGNLILINGRLAEDNQIFSQIAYKLLSITIQNGSIIIPGKLSNLVSKNNSKNIIANNRCDLEFFNPIKSRERKITKEIANLDLLWKEEKKTIELGYED